MSSAYISPDWQSVLAGQNLRSFNDWWTCQSSLVDEPNRKGRGWSEVSCLSVTGPTGDNEVLYVKRQQYYRHRSFHHPIFGEPTFASEQRNIIRFQLLDIPALESVFYQCDEEDDRAILVTRGLKNFVSLYDFQQQCTDWKKRRLILRKVALAVAHMHEQGFMHTNLYPKHIYVNPETQNVRFIDLETARRHFNLQMFWLRDIETLNRRGTGWLSTERWYFWKQYLNKRNMIGQKKSLAYKLLRRTSDKRARL
jgi:tRNA A-37 threonylcarbamoyl transferase component Bud32